jgi:nitroreductase
VVVGRPIWGVAAGSYVYDISDHSLVALSEPCAAAYSALPARLAILIRSRVERAMWRYRDLRALRPVLIDAGHVVETLCLVASWSGLSARMSSPPPPPPDTFDWLLEPELAVVELLDGSDPTSPAPTHDHLDDHAPRGRREDSGRWLTSPAVAIQFGGSMRALSVWPERSALEIDLTALRVLNHCLPSNRGDRDTTVAGIKAAVAGSDTADASRLRDAGLLLPADQALDFYRAIRLWARHDWYLSCLAYLESRDAREPRLVSPLASRHDYVSGEAALLQRRTTRVFSRRPLPRRDLAAVLAAAEPGLRGGLTDVRLFAAVLAIDGLDEGLYEQLPTGLRRLGAAPSRAEIQHLTTGQQPAGAGACTLWLVSRVDPAAPQRYALTTIELGRIAQRICLAASEAGVGAFLTPAVKDGPTLRMLEARVDRRLVSYVVSLGVRELS